MISRLTAYAACFAILSAATIVFAANSTHARPEQTPVAAPPAVESPVVNLPRVEIVGRRLPG